MEDTSLTQQLTEQDIIRYLQMNPDFLARHPELVDELLPPARNDVVQAGAEDFQAHMIHRMRDRLGQADAQRAELVEAARDNQQTIANVMDAVLALVGTKSLDEALEVITQRWPTLLDVDVITLAVEARTGSLPREVAQHVFVIDHGAVDALLGDGSPALLSPQPAMREAIYGPAAPLVQSDALVRFQASASAPIGLVAFGSRSADQFNQDQGTELLEFLASAVGRIVRLWLDLP